MAGPEAEYATPPPMSAAVAVDAARRTERRDCGLRTSGSSVRSEGCSAGSRPATDAPDTRDIPPTVRRPGQPSAAAPRSAERGGAGSGPVLGPHRRQEAVGVVGVFQGQLGQAVQQHR